MSSCGKEAVFSYYDKYDIYEIISENIDSNNIFNNYLIELCASNSCELKCLHCLHGNANSNRSTLRLEQWMIIFNEFYRLGVKHFHITGKEPFMSMTAINLLKSLYKLKKYNDYDFKFGVSTNCLFSKLKPKDVFSTFTPDYIELSVDGLEKYHDFLRGKGNFSKILTNLLEIQHLIPETQVSISTVLHKKNINSILSFLDFFAKRNVSKFFFQILEPLGYGRDLNDCLIESADMVQIIDDLYCALTFTKGIDLKICISEHHIKMLLENSLLMKEIFHSFLETGDSTIYKNSSSLQFAFSIFDIPYWKRSIISSDGFVIDNATKYELKNIEEVSLGNIFEQPIGKISSKIKAQVKHELNDLILS